MVGLNRKGNDMQWQIAGGTVCGTMHQNPVNITNNQDAFHWIQQDDMVVAVVCDGCGSSPHSEVGAQIGVRLAVEYIKHFSSGRIILWSLIKQGIVEKMLKMSELMGNNPYRVIRDYFLFTINGVIITDTETTFFTIGDGFAMLNDDVIELGDYPDDAPPYIVYAAILDKLKNPQPELYQFKIHKIVPTSEVDHILIGTDGVGKYLLPAMDGDLSTFWAEDCFQNADQVRRKLAVINKTNCRQRGPLRDDTTLITIRRG